MKKFIFYIKRIIYDVYKNSIFKIERLFYVNRKNKRIKRRIFWSSGNISLVNVLTIISELPKDNYEDILIIDTSSGNKNFFDINLKTARLHNFKKIYKIKNDSPYFVVMKHNLFKIDEVYAHTKELYFKHIQPLYKECPFKIFDEGFGSLIEQPNKNNKNISQLITVKYCDKLDRLGWENIPIIHPDVNNFRKIADKIAKKYPFDIEIPDNSKTVIFCGGHWQAFKLGKKEFYDYQNDIMKKLLENGFDVIYKPHPRDESDISLPFGVVKTNCMLPLELYNLDILAVVAIASVITLQLYHYNKIPGFSNINEKTFPNLGNCGDVDIIRYILKEYNPDVNEILNINANEYSKLELKKILLNIFKAKFDNQPLLSENKFIKEKYEKYKNEFNSRQKR